MATVLLDFEHRTVDEKLTLSQSVIIGCTNNANLSDPNPPKAVELATRRYRLAVARAGVVAAKAALAAAVAEQKEAEDEVDEGFSDLGAYVQDETGGDPVKIPTTNFGVASESNTPVSLTAPAHYDLTLGDEAGELHADWDNVPGARGYISETTTDLTGAAGWSGAVFSTASNVDLQGLTPGTVYLARTRAVGAKNAKGPWSQSVQRRAP